MENGWMDGWKNTTSLHKLKTYKRCNSSGAGEITKVKCGIVRVSNGHSSPGENDRAVVKMLFQALSRERTRLLGLILGPLLR